MVGWDEDDEGVEEEGIFQKRGEDASEEQAAGAALLVRFEPMVTLEKGRDGKIPSETAEKEEGKEGGGLAPNL